MVHLVVDTLPEIEQLQIEHLRKMPPWRKMELLGEMNRMVHDLAIAGLCQRYPDDTPKQIRRRLVDLLLGPEMAERVYGCSGESGC